MIRLLSWFLCCVAIASAGDADRIAEFREAIAADRQSLSRLKAENDKQIADLEGELSAAAKELVQTQLALQGARRKTASLQASARTSAQSMEGTELALRLIESAANRARSHADLLLSEVPASGDARKRLATTTQAEILDEFVALHRDATSTRILQAQVYRPDGTPAEAELLAVSNAHFAYQLPDKTAAVSLSSPSDASGYRWAEDLDAEDQAAVTAAVSAVKAGQAAVVPMDVTGTLRVASWRTDASWVGRIKSGGALMFPLALVALVAVVLILERLFVWNRERGRASVIAEALMACRERRVADAEETLRAQGKGVASRLMLAALARQPEGQTAMEDGIEVCLLQETPKLRHRLSGIAVLGAVAPLLGLLGTVTGIIETFAVIKGSGTTDAGLMAGGISQALVTTAAGLVIAIPILLFHRLLSGAMDRIISDAEFQAANALTILAKNEDAVD
jgi:biopolymer transport protein ExbB